MQDLQLLESLLQNAVCHGRAQEVLHEGVLAGHAGSCPGAGGPAGHRLKS